MSFEMKNLIVFAIVIGVNSAAFCQNVTKIINPRASIYTSVPDTGKTTPEYLQQREHIGKVNIIVVPKEASNASIAIIKTTKILTGPSTKAIYTISPDTIGIRSAPLTIDLASGDYNIVASKQGFRKELKSIEINQKKIYKMKIQLFSLVYLHQKRAQWNKIKWISAAIAFGTGLAAYYFHSRIDTYQKQYNNAISPSSIQNARNSINENRSFLRISSGIAFTALGSFGITWLIQATY